MEVNLKLLDHIQLSSRLHANFACEFAEDGKIFLLLETGICVLTLKGCMDNIFSKFSFKKYLIKLSNTSICENVDIDLSSFVNDLSRDNLYEAVLDVSLSGNNLNATTVTPKPVFAMWSPRGIVEKTDGALAVLTNLHNIEIYVEAADENEVSGFILVANFSKDISEHYRRTWKRVEGVSPANKLLELKKRVDLVTPTAFTWSHIVLKDRRACCILFVGHRDGAITAWRFIERKASEIYESRLLFLERYNTKLKHITALHWLCRKSDAGGLTVGDIDGQICALSVSKLSTDKIRFGDEVVFTTENDLKVDKITVMNHQTITYLVAVKQNYLQVFGINAYGEVFKGKLLQIGNIYITGILHYEKNSLLVLNLSGQLQQIEISTTMDNQILVSKKTIQLNIDTNKYRTHGFLFSPNKVFLAILAYPCHFKDVIRGKSFVNFFVFANTSKDPLQILMNTTSTHLRDHWDCFETSRVKCLQEKVFPWKSIDVDINYDTMSLLKLKIMRWIAKLSEKIYPMVARVEEYNIKAYVLLNYLVDIKLAIERITKLLNIYFSEKKLSLFQMRSLDLLNFFLKEMVAKDILAKANVGETFIREIFNVMRIANELQYPPMPQCVWCGEKIIGSSCIPYHADSRCAISLMPIHLQPGYKCPFCRCVVHKEMDKEYYPIFCPYCDIPMRRCSLEKKFKKTSEEALEMGQPEEAVLSECSSDCCKDDMRFSDIEENTTEYVVFTDSEDEKDDVKKLYARIRKLAFTGPFEEDQAQAVESSTVAEQSSSTQSKNNQNLDSDADDDDVNDDDDDYDAGKEYDDSTSE